MELLIIKSGQDYIRFKEDVTLRVKLDKASVFTVDQMDQVKARASRLKRNGFAHVTIKKLVLREEELST